MFVQLFLSDKNLDSVWLHKRQVIILLNSGNHIRHRICNAVGRMGEFLGTSKNNRGKIEDNQYFLGFVLSRLCLRMDKVLNQRAV